MALILDYFALSDVGRKRLKNEDRYQISENRSLFLVADGMGGHIAGEVASKIAVDTIEDFITLSQNDQEITWPFEIDDKLPEEANKLKVAIQLANQKIFTIARDKPEYEGMGTTIAALYAVNNSAFIGHVGDSRVYLCRDGVMKALTSDHSWVNMQVDLGVLSSEEAHSHPLRNIVTRALGTKWTVDVDIQVSTLRMGDTLLLCSDGLSSLVEDSEIAGIIQDADRTLEQRVQNLVARANELGGEDNITAIVIETRNREDDEEEQPDDDITEVIPREILFRKLNASEQKTRTNPESEEEPV